MLNIFSMFILVLGFIVVVGTIKEGYVKNLNKATLVANLTIGFSSFTIGSIFLLNIVSERTFLRLLAVLFVLSTFFIFRKKKEQNI